MLETGARRALLILHKEENVCYPNIVHRVTRTLGILNRDEQDEISVTTTRQCRRDAHSSTATSKKAKCQKLLNATM